MTIQTMKITLKGNEAFGLIRCLKVQEDQSKQTFQYVTTETPGELRLWIEGVETVHTIQLRPDGTWHINTDLPI